MRKDYKKQKTITLDYAKQSIHNFDEVSKEEFSMYSVKCKMNKENQICFLMFMIAGNYLLK